MVVRCPASSRYAGGVTEPVLPDALASLLPASDRRAPVLSCADGHWVAATAHALHLFDADGEHEVAMWYEVLSARWNAQSRVLTVRWVDPARGEWVLASEEEDPRVFMGEVTERVNRALVLHKELRLPGGTTVSAQVRRRSDDALFSVLVADGPIRPGEEAKVDAFEHSVRESVGLD